MLGAKVVVGRLAVPDREHCGTGLPFRESTAEKMEVTPAPLGGTGMVLKAEAHLSL